MCSERRQDVKSSRANSGSSNLGWRALGVATEMRTAPPRCDAAGPYETVTARESGAHGNCSWKKFAKGPRPNGLPALQGTGRTPICLRHAPSWLRRTKILSEQVIAAPAIHRAASIETASLSQRTVGAELGQ